MAQLTVATLLMVVSHVVPSAPAVRSWLIDRLGPPVFHIAYSAVSLVALGLVVVAFQAAEPGPWLFTPGLANRWIAVLGMPLAILLVVGRLSTPADHPDARGIYRLTPIPGSLGVLLWCALHLLNLAEARLVVVFGGMAAIALAAALKHGRRGRGWRSVGGGMGRIVGEIGPWRLGLTLAIYAPLLWLHPMVFGVDPLAGLG